MYCCSPKWEKEYINRETVRENIRKIQSLGCHSVHIGGGEPFLDVEGLRMVLETAREMRMHVEYVETNSSWYKDQDSAYELLRSLKSESGLSTLLVSISPFHNEHIPFYKVKGVLEACRLAHVGIFPWISEFYSEVNAFDDRIPHSLPEYVERYGKNYFNRIPSRYWIHFGGRALRTFEGVFVKKDLKTLLSSNQGGCSELLDVSHFHLDLFGNYIPGLCSGLAIGREDLGAPLLFEDYPFLSTLFHKGISGFLNLASAEYGFIPSEDYLSKCHLCLEIRRHLVLDRGVAVRELQPPEYYRES